jgi:hypothetical protein
MAYPGRVLHGKVLFVSDVIEPDSRRNKVRIAFANADHATQAQYVCDGHAPRGAAVARCPAEFGVADE